MSPRRKRPFKGFAMIYTLSDESGNVFYVGSTIYPIKTRMLQHLSEAKCNVGNEKKNSHIRSLNYKVVAQVVDIISVEAQRQNLAQKQAIKLENEYINQYAAMGYDLCNFHDSKKLLSHASEITKLAYIGQRLESKVIGSNELEISEVPRGNVPQDITSQSLAQ